MYFSCAYHITSQRTKRPSASVFITSIVSPFIDLTTSPGRCAVPDGIFSTRPTIPTTFEGDFRFANAVMTPATTAAPPISIVMSSMPPAGFKEIPPVSKTTPFPTSASGGTFFATPDQLITTNLEGLGEP